MKNMSQSTDPQFPPHENTPLITTAQPGSAYLLESITGEEISSNLKPLDKINGYDVRPGFYEVNGASALPGGVNFTLASHGATSCELLYSTGNPQSHSQVFLFRNTTGSAMFFP